MHSSSHSLPRAIPLYLSRWAFLCILHIRYFFLRAYFWWVLWAVRRVANGRYVCSFVFIPSRPKRKRVRERERVRGRGTHTKRTRRKSTIHSAVLSYFTRFICSLAVVTVITATATATVATVLGAVCFFFPSNFFFMPLSIHIHSICICSLYIFLMLFFLLLLLILRISI